ncbi:MAG: AAA family ATPase [Candidatus Bipolaricaulia bacterium]
MDPFNRKPQRNSVDQSAIYEKLSALRENVERIIQGKSQVVKLSVITLLANGHLLIEDVPGVGKTTLAHGLAKSLAGSFRRIQFTSDLLPSDILGVNVYNEKRGEFEFKRGPIFAHIVLADEINRATPKTQSALLEAMSEAEISIDSRTHPLPEPFMILATQNPHEYHGIYPLPESQLDRFLMRIRIGYPSREDEKRILEIGSPDRLLAELEPVLSGDEVLVLQQMVREVVVDGDLQDYILRIVVATRSSELLELGVSPRGALALQRAAQALVVIEGRDYCTPDDIKQLAPAVLAHRVVLAGVAGTPIERGEQQERVIQEILEMVEVPL